VKDNIASFEVIKGTLEDVFLNCLNGVKHDWFNNADKKKY
jgi:hypothetical protein